MASTTGTGNAKPKSTITRVQPKEQNKPKKDRDPNKLNTHLHTQFYDVLGEPSGVRSFDCIWEFSEVLYDCSRVCLYKLFSLCCGVCIAIHWGLELVPIVFCHVWLFTPFNQCLRITVGYWLKSFWTLCIRCCVSPWTKSCAAFFTHCGDGLSRRAETPSIFPKSKPRPKLVKRDPEPEPAVVVPIAGAFDNYDKEKIAQSVRRQLLL